MSLLGIDIGTTGCKAAAFSETGELLGIAYEEYDIQRPKPGWAELDVQEVWEKVKRTIRAAAASTRADPITAISVASMGEAFAPVRRDRTLLGPSILNFDVRGEEFLDDLGRSLPPEYLYKINGNTFGNHYSLTKLKWVQEHQPEIYGQADAFLLWSSLAAFLLGAEPCIDYSLANRTLLFDIDRQDWSAELLEKTGLEGSKLPAAVASGSPIGQVSAAAAVELGIPPGTAIIVGAHDQCANAVGCGVIRPGQAVYGIGTFICITPVFGELRPAGEMLARGLNTEHHAVPGRFVSFIYNQGGSQVKWFRDTFAREEHRQAKAAGKDIYSVLLAEMPEDPSQVVVLPHFSTAGPPGFIADSCGVVAGLRLETRRGEILKSIIEGATFDLKECLVTLPGVGLEIGEFRAAGGGSKSDAWIQISADILDRPFVRPRITEAGALGAAIIAGVGQGVFSSFEEGTAAMAKLERSYEPDPRRAALYTGRFERYRKLWPLMKDYLRALYRDK